MSSVGSYRASSKSLWDIFFHFQGNFLCAIIPWCVVNCLLLGLVEYLASENKEIGFSPTGHGLLTMLVSFLVISKVNLAYERYKRARYHVGSAFLHLRELHQLCITLAVLPVVSSSSQPQEEKKSRMQRWRAVSLDRIVRLMDATKAVIQNENMAAYLAKNYECNDYYNIGVSTSKFQKNDPYRLVQSLQIHLFAVTADDLQMLERVQLNSKLNEYIVDYKHLLELASTPLPIPLVSMGRTFLFIWTFSMPLVLRQGPFTDLWTAQVFLFFLTYGFVGLELVSMKLSSPFGDGVHDIQVAGIRDATMIGMEQDLEAVRKDLEGLKDLEGTRSQTVSQRRFQFQHHHDADKARRGQDHEDDYSATDYQIYDNGCC